MSNQAIIGLNVLMQEETTINEMEVTVKSKCPKEEEINLISVLHVELTVSDNEFNIDPNVPNQTKNGVQYLVSNYEPRKTKSTNTELKICLTNRYHISRVDCPSPKKKLSRTKLANG